MTSCDVAIIGAGPYGLSAAAHLKAAGLERIRVYGECMSFWEQNMPAGMLLRSPWVASNFSDPKGILTLDTFKSERGNHFSAPIPLERFIDYGRWYQQRAVPDLDQRKVTCVEVVGDRFALRLEDGDAVSASRVVVASGILPFAWRPAEFAGLGPHLVSHSSECSDLPRFAGKRLVVLGGGQSALESAALLHEAGATVEVIVRDPVVRWLHQRPFLHSWPLSAMLYAWPDVGPALLSHIVARPKWFQRLPRSWQDKLGPRSIRPAGAQWLKNRVQGVLPVITGCGVRSARAIGRELRLILDDGSERIVDHLMLGTGYRVNIALYRFLSANLLAAIRRVHGFPCLDAGFESTVPGLHFLGPPAAWSFGPLLRFVAGTHFAARALTRRVLDRLSDRA